MITYRNPLWNITIKFLKELQDYEYFKDLFGGKYSKRTTLILDEALKKLHINGSNWKLFLETLSLISEKDITDEMREVFEESSLLGMSCNTTSEGTSIYNVAKQSLKERKIKEEAFKNLEKAKQIYEDKMEEHEEYMKAQTKTEQEFLNAKKLLEEAKKEVDELNKIIHKEEEKKENITIKTKNKK